MTDNRSIEFKKRVFRDEVAEYLINEIINYRLNPGDRIVETRVSKELQVSQGAVREAIRDLIAKGMLTSQPYKGTYVRSISVDDIVNYYKVRNVLEQAAVQWAADNGTLPSANAFDSIVQEMELIAPSGEISRFSKLAMDYHRIIVAGAENDILNSAWEGLGNLFWMAVGMRRAYSPEMKKKLADIHRRLTQGFASSNQKDILSQLEFYFDVLMDTAQEMDKVVEESR